MSGMCDQCGGCANWFCQGCNRGRCHCPGSVEWRNYWLLALPNLASSLRIAGALCAAWQLCLTSFATVERNRDRRALDLPPLDVWQPNVSGRHAPGYEVKP